MRTLTEYYDFLRLITYQNPWCDSLDFLLVHHVSGQHRMVCAPLRFVDVPEACPAEPTFKLHSKEAQELMDMLWSSGLRPTQGKNSVGQLEATERHLADMRSIAFGKLNLS